MKIPLFNRAIPVSLVLIAVLSAFIGLFTSDFLKLVSDWGHNIPSMDIAGDYLTAVFCAVVLGLSIFFWPVSGEDKRTLFKLWIIRCLVTLGFMVFFESQYFNDAYDYLLAAKGVNLPDLTGFGNGGGNINAFAWILNHGLFLGDSYHSLKVIFSMIGFIGSYLFYRGSVRYTGNEDQRLLYLLGLFPSLIFWSSILGKDPIVYFSIGLYFYGALSWLKRRSPAFLLLAVAGILLASSIRLWSAVYMIIPLMIGGSQQLKNRFLRACFVLLAVAGLYASVGYLSDRFQIGSADSLVQTTNGISHSWSTGGSAQDVPEFKSLGEMISFAPTGMFAALFRPLPGEVDKLFGLLAGLENLFLLGLAGLALSRMRLSFFRDPAITAGFTLVVVWSFLYGFASYQNLGSAERFKLQVLPVMLLLLFFILNKGKSKTSCAE